MHYPLHECKLIYRVLHSRLMEFPELIDTQFLEDLQSRLQDHAQNEGIDISDHSAWDAWLGNIPVGCAVRAAKRRLIE